MTPTPVGGVNGGVSSVDGASKTAAPCPAPETRPVPPTRLLWVDIETTGLNPNRNVILEVGLLVTTWTGELRAGANFIIAGDEDAWESGAGVDPAVEQMHTRSGLWNDCRASTTDLDAAAEEIVRFIDRQGLDKPPMAGSSVHFDRAFLKAQMPGVEALFHYRNFDVSTLRTLTEMAGKLIAKAEPQHRAMPDLYDSVREYRDFLALTGLLP